jgi:hypothetical protein
MLRICLKGYMSKLSLNAGAPLLLVVACERLKCHKMSRHVILGTILP